MNAREKILRSIAEGKPQVAPHPGMVILFETDRFKMIQQFKQMLNKCGGKLVEAENLEIVKKDLEQSLAKKEYVVNMDPEIGRINADIDISSDARSLAAIDRVYLKSRLGVAENGSVWLAESDMVNRLLPFICQHLVIILKADTIVSNMHEAYKRIRGVEEGFHVFLAGPSKTADIEQSLVIGAHGARSLLVYLIHHMD